jgi:diaminopimelate epimerase
VTLPLVLVKGHAYGNDFLLAESGALPSDLDHAAFARRVCERHRGIGADGLILFTPGPASASMTLRNADGSYSEVSGNGVRCLAAWIAREQRVGVGGTIAIDTEAGRKTLTVLDVRDGQYTFRAAMGQPERIARVVLDVSGQPIDVVTLRVGNPQCVVLGDVTHERLNRIAAALAVHPHFPEGTNVELATVEDRGRVRILIWERGVGPTEASGTGACAAAVAAIRYGGADRDVQVASPGGVQRVEWLDDGLYLTGWAELVSESRWIGDTQS